MPLKVFVKLKEKRFLVLYGPTGVGKTDVALQLAEHIPCEIVNMDMGQCYTPLSIGTAKPEWQSMKTPHHLFDIINEPRNITVVQYRDACLKVMRQIWARGNMPILVGGSGFYLQSLLFPPLQEDIPAGFSVNFGDADLWNALNEVDPQRARLIHPNDAYRLQRALHIWHSTGNKPSEYKPLYNPPASCEVYCIMRDRKELYDRIDTRVLLMIDHGWIDEALRLLGTPWEHFLRSKKIIGYSDIFDYLGGDRSEKNLEAMIHAIQQKTRNYAKRQMTFWRKLEKDIVSNQSLSDSNRLARCEIEAINLTLLDVDLYINQLLKKADVWFA